MRLAVLGVALAALLWAPPALAGNRGPQKQPNIVVVMSDDQTVGSFTPEVMPRTFQDIVAPGTSFPSFIVTTPLCCPSRVGFYTGQYGHNSGVLTNHPGYASLTDRRNMLPVWLRQAGYRTALIGKWLHGYEDTGDPARVAPGWSDWRELVTQNHYYGYDLSIDGEREHFGRRPQDFLTTVINRNAVDAIHTYAPSKHPFFLDVSQLAPHSAKTPSSVCNRSAVPAPGDEDLYANAPLPIPPSFDEADVSDKPTFIQRSPGLDPEEIAEITRTYRCRLASLREVDRGVAQITRALEREGELDETIFIFTGDNGYFQGEHRLRSGKGLPYEESIRQPFAIRVPRRYRDGAPLRSVAPEPVANIDLAPTLLELAGAEPCRPNGGCRAPDGRSLMPLIEGTGEWPADRGLEVEYESPEKGSGRRGEAGSCEYTGIRTSSEIFVEHTEVFEPEVNACVPTHQVENYDLQSDPFELDNLFPPDSQATAARQAALAMRLDSLRQCAGTPGNEVPGKPPCE